MTWPMAGCLGFFWQERVGPDGDIWDMAHEEMRSLIRDEPDGITIATDGARVLGGVYGYIQPDPGVPEERGRSRI